MSVQGPQPIPFPTGTSPGNSPQEGAGRLINCFTEPLGDGGPNKFKWIRSAGLSQFAATAQSGYRGGLLANNLSFEAFSDNASTVDSTGVVTSIGPLPGTKKISIARNQAAPTPDVVAVDIDNGAYVLESAAVVAATATVTIDASDANGNAIPFNKGDTVSLTFVSPALPDFQGADSGVTYTLLAGDTPATVATALTNLINANTTLSNNYLSAVASTGTDSYSRTTGIITVSQQGSIGNQTTIVYGIAGTETPAATSIGTQTSTSGATCALTGVTAPAGSTIVVIVAEVSANAGTLSDSVNGNYGLAVSEQFNTAADIGAVFYFQNAAALAAGTITYTKGSTGSVVVMSAFYITGVATKSVLDPFITAAANGSSVSPAVTSGQPSYDNELILGAVMCLGNPTYSQSSGMATPPVGVSSTTVLSVFGGNTIANKGVATNFAATLGTTEKWAAVVLGFEPGTGAETVTLNPSSGNLSGGQGTYGAFVGGVPTSFNGQGNLSQPNSVCFQDGYFFFTTAANYIYASQLNGLTMSALTYVRAVAKSDVTLLRGIAYGGFLLAFTTGSLEVWQDAANPAPAFPYSRIAVLELSLAQASAIAGWETGFSELLWVGQDNGVYWMPIGQLGGAKVSPPDLDRLIEAETRAGHTLEASCYVSQGKKFWALSSPNWTWEFNLQTKKWNERWSLLTTGIFGRWRATGGHPAFGKWMTGDQQTGDILYVDDANASEVGSVLLWRMESGPVQGFPSQVRVARGDFNFVVGVGQAVGSLTMAVSGAAAGTNGVVRLNVNSTAQVATGDVGAVSGVVGTTEANGNWTLTVIDPTHIELQSSVFANAYVSGGQVIDLTVPNNVVNPTVAVSNSKDGGQTYGNPLIRQLGAQQNTSRSRVSVTNMGLSSAQGDRWRLDITDPVYASFMGGTQSSDIRAVGG